MSLLGSSGSVLLSFHLPSLLSSQRDPFITSLSDSSVYTLPKAPVPKMEKSQPLTRAHKAPYDLAPAWPLWPHDLPSPALLPPW